MNHHIATDATSELYLTSLFSPLPRFVVPIVLVAVLMDNVPSIVLLRVTNVDCITLS